jgi:DNA polymerase-3 subunit alpha
MSEYTHLHVHSHYSLLDALPKINELVSLAKKDNMRSLALTDNGNLYGAISFYKKCLAEEIKPVIGVDFYVALKTRFDKRAGIDNKRNRLILLAQNANGYKNLVKLVTCSHLEGFYYKPRIDHELIEKYSGDLVAVLPMFNSEITQALHASNYEEAGNILNFYKKIFKDKLFLQITHHPEVEGHDKLKQQIIDLARKENVEIVASQDVFYTKKEDHEAWKTLLSVQSNMNFRANRDNSQSDLSFLSQKQMEQNFKDLPGTIENTQKIVEMCNVQFELGHWMFPDFKIEDGETADEKLREIVYGGLKKKNIEETKEIKERIEYELTIIKDKGYAPYFLTVGDIMNFAHNQGIVSTIRGSVAGSIVTYLANITKINPMDYKIPFERFLNPERPSAPDIDMDFADNCRDKVIEYVKEKYGKDKVAQIGTFGTMMARGSVRDTARALGYEYQIGDKIAKLIPLGSQGFPMTIDIAMGLEPDLKKMYKEDSEVKKIIDMAKKIEGCARHISVHAAGVVISPTSLDEIVPTQFDPRGGKIITQYDMHNIEAVGLTKFDFLGLKNLSILADTVKRVKWSYNIDIDIEKIPLDDKETFASLSRGETMGTFQLNGSGMTKFLKELRPTRIEDINAMVALYRPGPLESIPTYIARKHNPDLIEFLDPRMKDILDQSYGVITYQDDVLLIAINLAGYSWLEADKLRKAMGKKIPEVMQAEKEKLINGLIKHGMSTEKADKLWRLIEPFAAYGFGKAHAASYGRVAYQTAYMKTNYPVEYMASILTADSGDVEKIAETIHECQRMNITVLPPDINESFSKFTVIGSGEEKNIRFGLNSIKNCGEGILETIINEREKNGRFKSLTDFLERIRSKNLNKKSLESLIKGGAMDQFGERGQLLGNMEELLSYNREKSKHDANQDSLFGTTENYSEITLNKVKEASQEEKLSWEKELLGLYISGHPLDKYKDKLQNREFNILQIKEGFEEGMMVVVSGIIEEMREVTTKTGAHMAFLKLADFSGTIDVVIFPETFRSQKEMFASDNCISVKGRLSNRGEELGVVAEAVKLL